MSYIRSFLLAISIFLISAGPAFAHAVVKPNEVAIGAFQTFTLGVPNEKDNATIALRLVIPEGLESVSPNVKPGWTINVKKDGEDENSKVSELSWTGGSIPAGQRDDFVFSAKSPAEEKTLVWKVYQTYADGRVVSWDKDPNNKPHDDNTEGHQDIGPYSQTKVVNDLNDTNKITEVNNNNPKTNNIPMVLSVIALFLSGASFWLQFRK